MSAPEEKFALHIRAMRLPVPEREFRFHPERKWRFDFCWPDKKIAVEIDGGIYSGGRHTRGKGFEADLEKINQAVVMGWKVLRFTPKMVSSGTAIDIIKQLLV